MAINFGNSIMEGEITPSVQRQAPVYDQSGAARAQAGVALANGFGGAAEAVGGIVGTLFKQNQQDASTKILVDYEMQLLDLADAVDQEEMTRDQAMTYARQLRKKFLSDAPALQGEFDKIWGGFAEASGLGYIVREGTVADQAEEAIRLEALKLNYSSVDEYKRVLNDAQAIKALENKVQWYTLNNQLVPERLKNQAIEGIANLAVSAYPSAKNQIETALKQMDANPAQRADIAAQTIASLKSQISAISASSLGTDVAYITQPINDLLANFEEMAKGTVSTEVLQAQITATQVKMEAIAMSNPAMGRFIAGSKILKDAGIEGPQIMEKLFDSEVLDFLRNGVDPNLSLNILGNHQGPRKLEAAVGDLLSQPLNEEGIAELKTFLGSVVDGAYINERSNKDGALGYQATINILGSPEMTEWIKKNGPIPSQYSNELVSVLKSNYENQFLPVVAQYWNQQTVAIPAGFGEGPRGEQVVPADVFDPIWNGSAVEFVLKPEYAGMEGYDALVRSINVGDSSVAIPLNNLIRAQANALGVDAKTIWERDFANQLFGLGEEGISDRVNRVLDGRQSENSYVPEEDSTLNLASFQPGTPEFEAIMGPEPDLASLDPSKFVEPSSNPAVRPEVVAKFAGRRMPVSIRNNNMGAVSITGNVDQSWAARQPGFVGVTPRPANEGGYYAKYATPEHGVGAASKLLESYGKRGVDTPDAIVRRWSADKSAHNSYANTLVRYLKEAGYDAGKNTKLDLADPGVRMAVLKAKSHHEAGAGQPVYDDSVFQRGVTYTF